MDGAIPGLISDLTVSILVFVELALDGLDIQLGLSPDSWFQSLFSWNLLLMIDIMAETIADLQFQSLFSWNLLLMNTGEDGLSGQNEEVSILVFVELALDERLFFVLFPV